MAKASKTIRYQQVTTGRSDPVEADMIVESPVSLTVNGEDWLAFMCTPVDLEAMAIGFLYNEGLIQSEAEIASVRVCASGDNVDVWLHHQVEKPEKWRRTSGCTGGVTGVVETGSAGSGNGHSPICTEVILTATQVFSLIGKLFESQDLYQKAGGVHTSALSDGERIQVVAEDIGRHNTLDKITGRCLLEGISLDRRVLITTGRVSSEMMQKAARLGASIVISRTSPTSLSIEMAERWGITLIGYARRNRFNVYSHPERIAVENASVDCLDYYSVDVSG
jgi:FdhD protein